MFSLHQGSVYLDELSRIITERSNQIQCQNCKSLYQFNPCLISYHIKIFIVL